MVVVSDRFVVWEFSLHINCTYSSAQHVPWTEKGVCIFISVLSNCFVEKYEICCDFFTLREISICWTYECRFLTSQAYPDYELEQIQEPERNVELISCIVVWCDFGEARLANITRSSHTQLWTFESYIVHCQQGLSALNFQFSFKKLKLNYVGSHPNWQIGELINGVKFNLISFIEWNMHC